MLFRSLGLIQWAMAGILFEDIFDVKDIDPDGKKFDRGKVWSYRNIKYKWTNLLYLSVTPLY